MPRNFLSLTTMDYFARFLGTDSVTTTGGCGHEELKTWKLDVLCLLSGTQIGIFHEQLSYVAMLILTATLHVISSIS